MTGRDLKPVFINGTWRPARPVGSFRAVDPSRGTPLSAVYPFSSFEDVEEALRAGRRAAASLEKASPEAIASFFDLYAESILARSEELIETAHWETALPAEPRLRASELPRTTGQLHQAAEAVRDRSWREAVIDTRPNIRSIRGPLGGPVAVFGPNNFPFAFNAVAGGDFVSALAAGNPVLAKAHPAHPGTTLIFARLAGECAERAGLPAGTIQLLYHIRPEDGLRLVAHPLLGATAFTGSRSAGLKLKESAERAGKPVYLEMSSANPVFILPGALRERGRDVASELHGSCSLGSGQFCTKPGLVIVLDGGDGRLFLGHLRDLFRTSPAGVLLSRGVLESLAEAVEEMIQSGAGLLEGGRALNGPGFRFAPTLLEARGRDFLAYPDRFQKEAFGTALLAVIASDGEELTEIARCLDGGLAASIYSARDGSDEGLYEAIAPLLRIRAGRLLDDRMPTGLAVIPSMVHGGPYPATGHPGFTSVGIPASFLRFTALRCYDNVRPEHLPEELRDRNPTGRMERMIDGVRSRDDVRAG